MAGHAGIWNKEKLIAAIRELVAQGQSLRYCKAGKSQMRLIWVARYHFGSWRKAVEAAGVAYPVPNPHPPHLSREVVIERITAMHKAGGPLDAVAIRQRDSKTLWSARHHFGSWRNAIEAAGFVYYVQSRPVYRWTREAVVERIKAMHKAGEPLSFRALRAIRHPLPHQGTRLFGSWEAAITAAGLDYSLIRTRGRWTDAGILEAIRARHRAGKPLNSGDVMKEVKGLAPAACYHFGSWRKALKAAGLDYRLVLIPRSSKWTRETVIAEIRRLHSDIVAGGDPAKTGRRRARLHEAANKLMGSWDRAVKAAGLIPRQFERAHINRIARLWVREHEPWSEAETARFRFLVKNRTPTLAIAIHLARSETALAAKAAELRIKLDPQPARR